MILVENKFGLSQTNVYTNLMAYLCLFALALELNRRMKSIWERRVRLDPGMAPHYLFDCGMFLF